MHLEAILAASRNGRNIWYGLWKLIAFCNEAYNTCTTQASVASCVAKLTFTCGRFNRKVFNSSNSLLTPTGQCSRVGLRGNPACPNSSNYCDLEKPQNSNLKFLFIITLPRNVLAAHRNQQLLTLQKSRVKNLSLKSSFLCQVQSLVKFYRMFPDEGSCDITVTMWSKYNYVFARNLEKLFLVAAV